MLLKYVHSVRVVLLMQVGDISKIIMFNEINLVRTALFNRPEKLVHKILLYDSYLPLFLVQAYFVVDNIYTVISTR
jgi:hypothetical protein